MANKTRNSERNMRSQQIDKREEGDWSREDTSQFPMRTHIRDVREEFLTGGEILDFNILMVLVEYHL